jgi:uncharacterized protein (TIGR03435 family)
MAVCDLGPRQESSLSAGLVVTVSGLLALGAATLQLHAQAPAQPTVTQTPTVTFDVASIKRNKEAEAQDQAMPPNIPRVPGRAQTLRGGLLRGRGMTVKELIRDAYGYRNRARSEVVGGPDWIDRERYDVEAKAGIDFPPSTTLGLPPSGEAALRALLADRFKLKVRMESQRRPVYELVLNRADGKLGPNLVPSTRKCRPFFQREAVNVGLEIDKPAAGEPEPLPPCLLGVGLGMITAENMAMTDWVRILALRPQLNRTVIDRTGLTGGFDILLKDPALDDPGALNVLPPIKPMLEQQLGLTLRNAEAPVEILVIENIDHPTEN